MTASTAEAPRTAEAHRRARVAPYRPFRAVVARAERLSPAFRRLTLTGDELAGFTSGGADQRVKLGLPLPGVGLPAWPAGPDWYATWQQLPDGRRPPLRTYTVRAWRPDERELDVDVVLHGATGPASAWAERAVAGDQVLVVGPDARCEGARGGVEWCPPSGAGDLLLAGDETAVPAVCAIAEGLGAGACARVVLEVPTAADALDLPAPPGVAVTWLPRGSAPHGRLLSEAVADAARDLARGPAGAGAAAGPGANPEPGEAGAAEVLWDVPAPGGARGGYCWLAGEAGVVRGLRRCLREEAGLGRGAVAAMGYWRRGRGEPA